MRILRSGFDGGKTKRTAINLSLNRHDLNKLTQALEILHKRHGKFMRRTTFVRHIVMRICDQLIENERIDMAMLFDKEEV